MTLSSVTKKQNKKIYGKQTNKQMGCLITIGTSSQLTSYAVYFIGTCTSCKPKEASMTNYNLKSKDDKVMSLSIIAKRKNVILAAL